MSGIMEEGRPSGVTVVFPLRLRTESCIRVNYTGARCGLFWSVHLRSKTYVIRFLMELSCKVHDIGFAAGFVLFIRCAWKD